MQHVTVRYYHVTSSLNRESITQHGLDWTRMALAHGIAGSRAPEQNGCFLCRGEDEVEWFVDMNNTGGPVDVWAVDGVDQRELLESPEGYYFVPRQVASRNIELMRRDVAARRTTRTTSADGRREDPVASEPSPGLFFEL